MIFGISIVAWLQAILVISLVIWIILYLSYLFGVMTEANIGQYFRVMFKGFEKSELRIGWRSIILGVEYISGLVVAALIKSAWYPSQWTKKLIGFVLFSKKKAERLEREKLKDVKKKSKPHDGVY